MTEPVTEPWQPDEAMTAFIELDHDRARRRGYPEAVYCEGKTPSQVRAVAEAVKTSGTTTLFTRASPAHAEAVLSVLPDARYDEDAHMLAWPPEPPASCGGRVLVVAAGTSDFAVAREAQLAAVYLGRAADLVTDVGIAGLHRILARLDQLRSARVIVVVAGMDGALPGVVAGLVSALLANIAAIAASTWAYFHLVWVVGLAPGTASVLMLIGGSVGMSGFPLGARSCERYGRIPTIVVARLSVSLGALGFYWGPPAHIALDWLWIGVTYCSFTAGLSAELVSGHALATEIFPTAIRGVMMGWLALIGAVAAVSAQALIAVLSVRAGGLSIVVGYLSLLAIPSALIVAFFLPETRGLSLEAAALEDEPKNVGGPDLTPDHITRLD